MDSLSISAHQGAGGGYYGFRGPANSSSSSSSSFQHHQQNQPTSYEVWNSFFVSAGIPSGVAHEYAITFSQHRIRIDMLKEITKDILLDMGIKAMGDIIAILRHAKQICTQNELKTTANTNSGSMPAKSSLNNHQHQQQQQQHQQQLQQLQQQQMSQLSLTNTSTKQHLSHRTPITLDRSSASVSSLIGNKIQSRLNLDSGALIASSSSYSPPTNSTTSNSLNNKRLASALSTSMAKRLRPAQNEKKLDKGPLPEKTLTVHYPSREAIARAAQRLSSSNSNHQTPRTGSIKSRLGSTASHSGRGSESFNQTAAVTNSRQRNRSSSMTPKKSNSSTNSSRRHESRQSKDQVERGNRSNGQDSRRPKSTVFNRLGEAAR